MKKLLCLATFGALTLGASLVAGGPSEQDKDLAAVMRVVQRAESSASAVPARQEGKPAERIKLLIKHTDGDEEISLSFPLSLVEWLVEMDEDETLDSLTGDDEIKLKDVLEKLKGMGPTELLEIRDKEGLIRIWLE